MSGFQAIQIFIYFIIYLLLIKSIALFQSHSIYKHVMYIFLKYLSTFQC